MSVLFLTLAGVVVFARVFELEGILDPGWADSHLRGPAQGGFISSGVLLYLALVALLSPLGVPRQALSALGGYAFGALWGSLLDHATVYSKEDMRYTFKDGTEIKL